MKVVAALGGNALARRGEPLSVSTQRAHVRDAARALAPIAREHALVVTHGNGPQVGLLALQANAVSESREWPLDVLDAESEGLIGYLIEQELARELPQREIATLLTQVEVHRSDPAFLTPTKPIGPGYGAAEADRLTQTLGYRFARDGERWRRVVASPEPRRIRELGTIRLLLDAGVVVVCGGGGGIPVTVTASGGLEGVEAVIDKDLSAALLADGLRADALLLLTDVDAVYDGFGTDDPRPIRDATPEELRARSYPPGSMGPKVEAACRFAAVTGRFAAIGALEQAAEVLAGAAGTRVCRRQGFRREAPC
ncbi:MAG: carbamate kinase [Deltaproteobacteria bacterium]|nr:carbamate kinase [Deltaproteobacteria bacterium]